MMHRVFMILLVVSLIASQGGIGAMAYFNDNEQNANNTVTAVSWWEFLHPDAGEDRTNGTYNLSPADLATLDSSDNNRYTTQDDWDSAYSDNESLRFTFPNIPGAATIVKASVTVEWSRESKVSGARLKVFDGLGSEQTYALTLPPQPNNDYTETIDVSAFVDTAQKVNNLEVWFQAVTTGNGPKQTKHDLVEVMVAYQ